MCVRCPQAWSSMPIFEDVEPMLAELRQRGWRLAVLTNCDDGSVCDDAHAFRAPFDLVLTAERIRATSRRRGTSWRFERLTRVDRRDWCTWRTVGTTTSHRHVRWASSMCGWIAT
jgi:hypothetical protein